MSGILSGRVIGAFLSVVAVAGVTNTAAASTNQSLTGAQVCSMALLDIEEARDSLDDLQEVVATAKANRTTLRTGATAITASIQQAATPEDAAKLRADRRAVLEEIQIINTLLPPIEAQADALAREVDMAELGYLTCIESTLP